MSDHKQFRSEESRKNYEKAERQRAQAQKRKSRNARYAEMSHAAAAWLKQRPLQAIGTAAAVIAVIVLAAALIRAVSDPLRGKQDNWLIANVSGTTDTDYRHLADFDIPQGFTRDDYSTYPDETTQDFFCIAEDRSSIVQDVYVSASKAQLHAADFPTTILSYNLHKAAGEPRQLTVAGKDCHALYMVTDESEYYGEGLHLAHMSFYFDTDEGACVTAIFRSNMMPIDELPDEAAMLAEAERILENLTLVK